MLDFHPPLTVGGQRAQVRQDAIAQARLPHHRKGLGELADLLRHFVRKVFTQNVNVRVRTLVQTACRNAQQARALERPDIHWRMLQRMGHRLGERLARAERGNLAIAAALRHARLHATFKHHREEIERLARAAQRAALFENAYACVQFIEQLVALVHGYFVEDRGVPQQLDVFPCDSHELSSPPFQPEVTFVTFCLPCLIVWHTLQQVSYE